MISNQILQNTIDGLKAIAKREITIMDAEGSILATTEESVSDNITAEVPDLISSKAESMQILGYQFFKVFDDNSVEYVVSVRGEDEEVYKIGKIAAFQIQSLLVAYKERFDKDNYIKNLLLDNMLLVDIYARAKKLHIENTVPRVVYFIESNNDQDTTISIVDVVRNLYPIKGKDFITAVDEKHIILVKDVSEDASRKTIEKTAKVLTDMLGSEVMGKVRVAIGSVVTDLKDISRSYKEAKLASEVGKIFYEDKIIINYNWLGIGRLIYQLPQSLCAMYIDEIFTDVKVDDLDEEMLSTINKFFQNSLNISETSRQLYIHRNTLVYRLDKLLKTTGLDIRVFDDAITFKMALMVAKYMNYLENSDF